MGLHITRAQYDRLLQMALQIQDGSELEARIAKPVDPYAFQRVLSYFATRPSKRAVEVLDITVREMPNIRLTIDGIKEISSYCKTGAASAISGMRKTRTAQPEHITEHGITVKLSEEEPITSAFEINNMLGTMRNLSKHFRMKKRTSFQVNEQFRVDCSIVRTAANALNLSTTSINLAPTSYEVEVEYVGGPVQTDNMAAQVTKQLLSLVSEILKVIDDCEYLIPASQAFEVVSEYASLAFLNQPKLNPKQLQARLTSNPRALFIGPQPISMELRNLLEPRFALDSVRVNYTVTHKADGERNLVFVARDGQVYLVNNRMSIKRTKLNCPSFKNSIFDAEVINLKTERQIHVFDAYFVNGESIANLPLATATQTAQVDTRIGHAFTFVTNVRRSHDERHSVHVKEFKVIPASANSDGRDLFIACRRLLAEQEAKTLPYETDGLIFTPLSAPVGALPGTCEPRFGVTWTSALKWKPAKDNTIDFLVKVRKIPGSQRDDVRQNESGGGMSKVLDLHVGTVISDTNAWDFALNNNPRRGYMPMLFSPPGVEDLATVNSTQVALDKDGFMRCINNDIIVDGAIVEMAWSTELQCWKPLRVRIDKMPKPPSGALQQAYNRQATGTPNNADTAERVWSSIVHPVTREHITGEKKVSQDDIPMDLSKYYAGNNFTERGKTLTIAMANFHNLWVKNRHLIGRLAGHVTSLADLGCGKGGDLGKWLDARITTVLGLDLFPDNIYNPHNGVYKRLMRIARNPNTQYNRNTHTYLFLPYDVSKQLTRERIMAIPNEQERTLAAVAFGYMEPPSPALNHLKGMAHNGFDVVSSQFAIHYFFKNDATLNNFIFNVDKCLKPGGYFIGTCFDGATIARALETTDFISGEKDNTVIWSIQRLYDLPYKPGHTGQAIKVFMETISQPITEYLVDYNHLTEMLSQHSIYPLTQTEYEALGLKDTTGMFGELFQDLANYVNDMRHNLPEHEQHLLAIVDNMTTSEAEKRISFFNRWFVFKKAEATFKKATTHVAPPKKRIVRKKST